MGAFPARSRHRGPGPRPGQGSRLQGGGLSAIRAAINCARANREIITHLARQVFAVVLPAARLDLLYGASHNICKLEEHVVGGTPRELFVHRNGAIRAFGPGHPDIPAPLSAHGRPVLIGGSMGTASYVLTPKY